MLKLLLLALFLQVLLSMDPCSFLTNASVILVDPVDGLCGRIVNFSELSSLLDRHLIFRNQLDKMSSLFVRDRLVLLSHRVY